MKQLLFLGIICLNTSVFAQVNIIPQPAELKMPKKAGKFTITPNTPVILDGTGQENAAAFLNDYLQQVYGFTLKVWKESPLSNGIHLNFERLDHPVAGAYTMQVKRDGVFINGDNETGTFYGIQSLLQLLPVEKSQTLSIPYVNIKDYPRFQYRGLHLDVARHFFPVDFVKRYIDYIALHKMNYFHWHLTEDQGWRIEIKKYPKLTEVGAYRNGTIIGRYPGTGNDNIRYGGFYTQEEVKEIVAYAAKRYVTVIPEIEMPGHSCAALTAYPNLGCTGGPYEVQQTWGVFDDVYCAGNDTVFTFLQDVLDEVIALFPSKYIHIGGDECPKVSWKKCPKCQQRMKDHNLKDEHELQSYFVQRMEKYINSKGKIMIGWDEILEGGLAPNAVVMSWRGEKGGIEAAKQNHDVIMTPGSHVYLDHSQTKNEDSVTIGGYTTVQKIYSYEPVPKELTADEAKHVLGAQGNVWTEYMKNTKKVEYMIFPRVSALSEVLWSPKDKRNWTDFEKRLQVQFKRYDLWGANYSKAYFDLKASILPTKNNNGVLYTLATTSKEGKIQYTTALTSSQLHAYTTPLNITGSGEINATLIINGKPFNHIFQKFSFNKATGKKVSVITKPSENYPGNEGVFGLVNGALSDKGINSAEWLGWDGPDMEAIIDLGTAQNISDITVHILEQKGSWIYAPQYIEASGSDDGNQFSLLGKTNTVTPGPNSMGTMKVSFAATTKRYVKVIGKNYGIIPDGQPGAGHKAWLFVDEIQVN